MKFLVLLFFIGAWCTQASISPLVCDLALHGNGTVYYDNGNVLTYNAGKVGATWSYSNGKVITYSAGKKGASWSYSNGQTMTYGAGNKGATWYYPNGNVITYSGPEMTEEELMNALCKYAE